MLKIIIFVSLFILNSLMIFAQANEILPLGNWQDTSLSVNPDHDLRYNDVWGIVNDQVEYAVIGSTDGTHFIDLSDLTNPTEVAFVKGTASGPAIIHRDYKSYGQYVYAVCDEDGNGSSTLQVFDCSYLPDSVKVVYDSGEYLNRAHDLWVDAEQHRLYSCGVRRATVNAVIPFQIFDLTNPANPTFIVDGLNFSTGESIPYVHDLYVRHDTAFLNCGEVGLLVVDCADPQNLVLLGTLTDYPQKGYNHSGWWDPNGEYYYLADETHGTDIKVVSTADITDMSVVSLFDANSSTTSIVHNLILHDDLLYVSYYYDGLQIYDVSNPLDPQRIAYYDTYLEPDGLAYKGAWGVYPLLPSGIILLSDMQTGLYVFGMAPLGLVQQAQPKPFALFPNPTFQDFQMEVDLRKGGKVSLEVVDDRGRMVFSKQLGYIGKGKAFLTIAEMNHFPSGKYLINIRSGKDLWQEYLIKQ